jgi:hypothetical protein
MADFTPEEIEQFREQFRKLNEELKRLGGTAFKEMPGDINDVVKSIKFLSNEINDIKNAFGSISQTLKNTISDFNSAGKLISSINNSYGKLSSLTAKVQEHISGTNLLSVKELTNIKTRAKVEVENLDNQRKLIASKLSEEGISERQRKTLLAQQLELNDAFEEQEGYLLSIDDLLEQQIIKEKEINKNLGLTGSLFKGISKTLQRFGIDSEIIKEMGDELREAAENGKVGFKDLFDITTKGFKKAMEDPMARFVLGLKLAQSGINDFKKAFEAFKEFNSIIISTARNLGLSGDQVRNFSATAVASQAQLNDKFNQNVYSTAQLTKSLQEINEQLGLSVNIGQENNNEFTKMTQTMGLSADEATKIYKLGTLNNMSLKDTNKAISAGIVAAQKQTGVQINARQVFQEIGKLSAGITSKFQQNPEALAKAVAQAKALGTSLETAEKVSESLLNFESSIENELKAELLTGRQINVEKARYAALTGDQATLTQELADQVGSLGEFQEMNVLAQKSLAEAFGLSRDEVADMLTKQETFNKLGDVSKKSAAEQLAIARERGLSEEDSLVVNLQQQAAAEKLEATFANIKMALGDILAGPLGGLVNMMASLSKNTGLVYALLTAMAGISLGKLILGIASMASSLITAGVAASTVTSALTFGAYAIGIAALLAGIVGAISSADDSLQSKVNKGAAFAKGGIVTQEINNATIGEAGPEAIIPLNSPKAGEMLGINRPTQPSFNTSAITDAIATLSNTVSGLVNRPNPTPQFALNVDGRTLGTVVGRQMETGTSQVMNTGYQMA